MGYIFLIILAIYFSTPMSPEAFFAYLAISVPVYYLFKLLIRPTATHKKYLLAEQELAKIDQMSGTEFERYCAYLLATVNYPAGAKNIAVTKASGDFGVDIIVDMQDGSRVAIQCKRYGKPLGIKSIQEVYAGKAHYGASRAIVITNQLFNQHAIAFAKETGVELIGRNNLKELLVLAYKATNKKEKRADDKVKSCSIPSYIPQKEFSEYMNRKMEEINGEEIIREELRWRQQQKYGENRTEE